jgi:CRP/FNR family transcriptional regulator
MVKTVTLREAWAGEADCKNCALRTTALFAGLASTDFDLIHDPIDQYDLKPGTTLYKSGDVGDYMYTVRSGALKLVQYLPDGSQRIVRIVRGSDVLGLEALLDEGYHHDAVALQRAEVCRFPTRVVRNLEPREPQAAPGADGPLAARPDRGGRLADRAVHRLRPTARRAPAAAAGAGPRVERVRALQPRGHGRHARHHHRDGEPHHRIGFKRESLLVESRPNSFLLDIPNLRRLAED